MFFICRTANVAEWVTQRKLNLISPEIRDIFSLKLNYEVRSMDWMLEGLLQGTQFQTLYNRRIEALRAEYNLRKIDTFCIFSTNPGNTTHQKISAVSIYLTKGIFPSLWTVWRNSSSSMRFRTRQTADAGI